MDWLLSMPKRGNTISQKNTSSTCVLIFYSYSDLLLVIFRQIIEMHPNNDEAYYNYGTLLLRQERLVCILVPRQHLVQCLMFVLALAEGSGGLPHEGSQNQSKSRAL
jgi:hypothetical protein